MIVNKPIKSMRPKASFQIRKIRILVQSAIMLAWLLPCSLSGQTEPSAIFEIQSTDKGFLLPRMTKAQRDAIQLPATGLMIYNTTTTCVDMNFGSPAAPQWQGQICKIGSISTLNCINATQTGTLTAGITASGVSVQVPYTGGNGGLHSGQVVTSTGVTGLTATLSAMNFATADGNLNYTISGTPATTGTASFVLNIGGASCTLSLAVESGSIDFLDCDNAAFTGNMTVGVVTVGVSIQVPYTGGDGGPHNGQTVTSTGVTGLTATLASGNFATGTGNLTYIISGTPAASGAGSFALNIGGQSCTLEVQVAATACWAKVSATDTLFFMCHNLASANTSAYPFTPSWEINGGYWQWGRLSQAAPGPSSLIEPNAGAISGWNTTTAPNGSWQDGTKTANDPCPAGYRVPTKAQWDAVVANNTQNIVGTWSTTSTNHTNYSAGRFFGTALMLPAAGNRGYNDGALFYRGYYGFYWSSAENGAFNAWYLVFSSGSAITVNDDRRYGFSVRCAAE
jgi:uncharacterized protein (TIGR02145 family)